MVCLVRPSRFKFFQGCLPQILFGRFLNTLTHVYNAPMWYTNIYTWVIILFDDLPAVRFTAKREYPTVGH